MKIGAGTVTWAFNNASLETALQEIATTGIKYIDIIGMLHGDPDTMTQRKKQACNHIIADNGLVISSILAVRPGTNIATIDQAARRRCKDYFLKIIELCDYFDAKEICFMAGHNEIGSEPDTAWKQAIEFSNWIADACAASGLYATYELEWRTCGIVQSVPQLLNMIRDVNRNNVLSNIDIGHAGLARDSLEAMKQVGSKTIHLHMNDNDTNQHTNAIPGEGCVPIQDYVQALIDGGMLTFSESIGHTIVAGIEVEDVSGSSIPPLDLITKSRDWILQHIPAIEL
jgi:sugar phosphate isomerase/epimerase